MEYKVDIGGTTYTMQDIQAVTITQPLFDKISVGNACSAELDISFWPKGTIPTMAEIAPYCRETPTSQWKPLGVFFIDTREIVNTLMNVVAYDSMLKSEITWTPRKGFTFPATMQEIAQDIALSMGVELDSRNVFHDYTMKEYPVGEYSRRDALRDIASAHAGNWIITAQNKLLLIQLLTSLPEETNYLVTEYGSCITFGGTRILLGKPYVELDYYSVSVYADPSGGGIVTGAGSYVKNALVTVNAYAQDGYKFSLWRENGTTISESSTYTFIVTGTRNLTAVFVESASA